MTFVVNFYAEKAYLSFVKEFLNSPIEDYDKSLERGSVCVIALACALEAILNSLLVKHSNIRHFDDFRFRSKVDTVCDISGIPIDWGTRPLQGIADLIRIRNWLVHFKDPEIGLINSEGEYLVSEAYKIPKSNPDADLSTSNIHRLYTDVHRFILAVAHGLNISDDFEYLKEEDFNAFLVG